VSCFCVAKESAAVGNSSSSAEPLEPLHRQPMRLFLFEPGKQMDKTPLHPAPRATTLDIELVKSNLHVLIHAHSLASPWASTAAT